MVDRVYPLKFETPEDGTQLNLYPNELDPSEDAVSVRGVYLQNDMSDDLAAFLTRDSSDRMTFQDGDNVTPVTLSSLLGVAASVGAEPVGFPNRDDSEYSFNPATRTFTISPTATPYDFYTENGVKYTKTTDQTTVIPDTEGTHFIYFDTSGVLQNTMTWTDDIVLKYAYVIALLWDADNDEDIYKGDERHGLIMDGRTHLHWHKTFGTSYYSGLGLNSVLTDEDGSLDTHCQLGTDAGYIADEDLPHAISAKTAPAQIAMMYRSGAAGNWRRDTPTNFPVKPYPSGRLAWNEWTGSTWQQSEASNNSYICCHLFVLNDPDQQWWSIQGQAEYQNLVAARQGATTELANLVLNGLPAQEILAAATLIVQTSNGFTNTVKGRFRSTDDGADWLDWRTARINPTSSPADTLTEDRHKALRHLIHFIEEGPAENFISGAYKETFPSATPFPTSVTWWESSSKLKKIVERTITWTGVSPTTDQWAMYDTDGTSVLVTVSDAISYSGVFETTRTRTITVA